MNTQVFLSARCNQAFLDDMRLVAIANDYEMPEDHHLAYSLIKDKLVPECFIQRVKKQLSQTDFVFCAFQSNPPLFPFQTRHPFQFKSATHSIPNQATNASENPPLGRVE